MLEVGEIEVSEYLSQGMNSNQPRIVTGSFSISILNGVSSTI